MYRDVPDGGLRVPGWQPGKVFLNVSHIVSVPWQTTKNCYGLARSRIGGEVVELSHLRHAHSTRIRRISPIQFGDAPVVQTKDSDNDPLKVFGNVNETIPSTISL